MLSFDAMLACQRVGLKAGEDISLVGVNCSQWHRPEMPAITSIDVSWSEVGRTAMRQLCQLSDAGQHLFESIAVRPQVVPGATCPVPADLLPVCADTGVPLVYDVHHHRCLPDGLSVAEATWRARQTWKAEPLFHISSPLEGWEGPKPERHHAYINAADFPREWLGWPLTMEIEAKAKELAVARLLAELKGNTSSHVGGIRVNDQWRLVFRWEGNNAYRVSLKDYH